MTYLTKPSHLPRIEGGDLTYDMESTGLHKMIDMPFLGQFRYNDQSYACRWDDNLVEWMEDFLPEAENVIGHGVKIDAHMAIQGGMSQDAVYRTNFVCTKIRESLINEHRREYTLDACCLRRGLPLKNGDELYHWLANKFGGTPTRKAQIGRISKAPIEMVAEYGIGDVDSTEALYYSQQQDIVRENLFDIHDLEMGVLSALVEIERRGTPVDEEALPRTMKHMEGLRDTFAGELRQHIPWDVNVNSGKQMQKAFEYLNLPLKFKPPTAKMLEKGITQGNASFDKETLKAIQHPFVKSVQGLKQARTMISTFLEPMPGHILNGKVYTNFNQVAMGDYGTVTGRLSSNFPNLQQVPKRDKKLAKIVRSLFGPSGKYRWICSDWDQFEFRMFAHYAKQQNVLDMYAENPNVDFHNITREMIRDAASPFVDEIPGSKEFEKALRNLAKTVNLGLIFGMGEGLMASLCGLPFEEEYSEKYNKTFKKAGFEAQEIFKKYHAELPNAKKFLEHASKVAKRRGYIKSFGGRRLRFPDKRRTYKAGSFIFQGGSADMMKRKIIHLNEAFRKTDTEIILIVHDEFNAIAPLEIAEESCIKIKGIMEDIHDLRVPIRADAKFDVNWWEASK